MDEPTPASDADAPEPHGPSSDRRLSPGAVAFLGLGLAIGLCLAITVGAGLALDAALHTAPAFLLVGMIVGLALAVGMAVSTVRKYL